MTGRLSKLAGCVEMLSLAAGILVVSAWAALPARAQDSGQDLYLHKCAVCHAKDGSGNTAKGKKLKVKNVRENLKDSEQKMIEVVTKGKGEDMDSYKGELSPDQIAAVVKYYRSLAK